MNGDTGCTGEKARQSLEARTAPSAGRRATRVGTSTELDLDGRIDFTQDTLTSGQRFPNIEPDGPSYMRSTWAEGEGRKPKHMIFDNDTEFTSDVVDRWAYEKAVQPYFIMPGCPIEHGYVECFDGKVRNEYLKRELVAGPVRGAAQDGKLATTTIAETPNLEKLS